MNLRQTLVLACALLLPPAVEACSDDTIPAGLRATPPGSGPLVLWDPTARPLPAIPLPNDFATFADPTSRTGLRINASVIAPTALEQTSRQALAELEGWGTFMPMAVRFTKDAGTSPTDPAVDIADVALRMQNDDHDMTNDPVYIVNLTTGVPVMVDMGDGNFPLVLREPEDYWPNDPHVDSYNLLFETHEEGAGLSQADYRPALDMDFDGILDHPNAFGPAGQIPGVDDIIDWYDLQTDTLVVRPLLPLEEKTEYAVVLTDRLHGHDGQPVRSPFPYVHHPSQVGGVSKLEGVLSKGALANYYGDIAGSGLDHVAFAWTFTTMPVHEDMKLLHDGLYGKGPFARFADQYPPNVEMMQLAGPNAASSGNDVGWQSQPACAMRAPTPFAVHLNDPDVKSLLHQFMSNLFGYSEGEIAMLERANENIDYLVIGSYQSPYLQGDPGDTQQVENARFHANFVTGDADVHTDTVPFWLAVPKATAKAKAPFPVMIWGHGSGLSAHETLIYAGEMARQGIATITIDMPEHGLYFAPSDYTQAQIALRMVCLTPFADAATTGRSQDYKHDGTEQSGWFLWTNHFFHVRDNIRQGTLDQMNALRILRTFDGQKRSDQDFNGDGTLDLAGDFNGDGVVDVGGPDLPYYAAGESLGGIMQNVLGGIEPHIVAATPMSGAAGLTDVGRSYAEATPLWEQTFGPLVVAVPASQRQGTACGASQMTLRELTSDGPLGVEIEIACLDASELGPAMTVVASNQANGERRCARTGADGGLRIELPSTKGDPWRIQIYGAPDVVDAYGSACNPTPGAQLVRTVDTFEVAQTAATPVADPNDTCTGANGCVQFRDEFYDVGSQLVAVNDGLGLKRQSEDLRQLIRVAQMALDPADPINYAPYYMLRPLVDENGQNAGPHALLFMGTIGDYWVTDSAGYAFARAAGALPFLPPQALAKMPEYAEYVTPQKLYQELGNRTPNQWLIDTHVMESDPRMMRQHAGPACAPDYVTKATKLCPMVGQPEPATLCAEALFDADWVSEGKQGYDQPHDVPLRLARRLDLHPSPADPASLDAVWAPREAGEPFSSDATGWQANAPLLGVFFNYIEPEGKHTWDVGDMCFAFDYATYGDGIMGRFLATGGKDLYYLSHPASHGCLADVSCDFER